MNLTGAFWRQPALPPGASVVTMRGLSLLGNRLDVTYRAGGVVVTLQAPHAAGGAGVDAALRGAASSAGRGYAGPCAAGGDRPGCAAAVAAAGAGAGASAGAGAGARRLTAQPLGARAQQGRVRLGDGHVVAPRALALVDAASARTPLVPGVAVALPALQSFAVVRA